jgi:hypothetical protein
MSPIQKFLGILLLAASPAQAEHIAIVLSPQATAPERTAADELATHLSAMYRADRFEIVTAAPRFDKAIFLTQGLAAEHESFAVTHTARTGTIAGADPRGVLYGVYALLEKLGWGFYLSYEAAPPPSTSALAFDAWNLSDRPVFPDRVIFNWHNFLSSASGWEIGDWQRWIRGAARMRFNTIMVHAYGNNPMFTFEHNGQVKPVGYLATTQKGRDWGTEHVNDVRRLWGGELFTQPVFGSSAALVPEAERTTAARTLVRNAFSYAQRYGLHVTFALDVDTESANPQNIILTLPESARFRSGKWQLANPDTPEGYAYWKAQAAQLLDAYPQIDRLVIWFRANRTPWRDVQPEELPAAWRAQFEAALTKNPALRQDRAAPSMFALARVTAAFDRALGELGRRDIQLGCGTWNFSHLPAANAFFAPNIKLYWLDQSIVFDAPATQALIRSIPRERQMLPIIWAHHDDRTFAGRPYTPFTKLTTLVEGAGTGFGIIHWTTRPLDLYFKSSSEQVWQATRDRPLKDTTREMAARSFGAPAADLGGEYLLKWVTEGRMFGRETSNRFIDVPLKDAADVIAKCRERIALLSRIDANSLSRDGRERLLYYRDFEEFTAQFFTAHSAFERAQDALKHGQVAEGRAAMRDADAPAALAQYAKASAHGQISRGEQALLIAMNLKWLPYFTSLREALGMEPARYLFQPTEHEPLAQGAGSNTFWIGDRHTLWKVLGEKETGAPAIASGAIQIAAPLTLKLGAIMGDHLAPGNYRVALSFQPGTEPASIEMRGAPKAAPVNGNHALVAVTAGTIEITFGESGKTALLKSAVISPEF